MEVVITVRLPRDAASVPVIRGILNAALGVIGVDPEVRDDIQVMLAEACTNVVLHARAADEYAVTARVCEDLCVLKVTDEGGGLIDEAVPEVAGLAESGRGLKIMEDLADAMLVANFPEKGLSVHLEKVLYFAPDALGERLHLVSANGVNGHLAR